MDGWRCPNCGRCYAPFVMECSACNPSNYFTFGTRGNSGACAGCGQSAGHTINGLCPVCWERQRQKEERDAT